MGGANHFPWGKYLPLPSKQCPGPSGTRFGGESERFCASAGVGGTTDVGVGVNDAAAAGGGSRVEEGWHTGSPRPDLDETNPSQWSGVHLPMYW
jgi:hypothetical protein